MIKRCEMLELFAVLLCEERADPFMYSGHFVQIAYKS